MPQEASSSSCFQLFVSNDGSCCSCCVTPFVVATLLSNANRCERVEPLERMRRLGFELENSSWFVASSCSDLAVGLDSPVLYCTVHVVVYFLDGNPDVTTSQQLTPNELRGTPVRLAIGNYENELVAWEC